ncbi:hypothetical protein EYF80_030788 [Liparis tanakae]|uniref:Uncharacterized protein n=1 Tax=Liparis tanakae TaxID=230148 RepID=A0A4Z2H2B7_9TELE|nr:hypothetical protein EYF80_030788 [Liparis tanakae]
MVENRLPDAPGHLTLQDKDILALNGNSRGPIPRAASKKASMLCCYRGVYTHYERQETASASASLGPTNEGFSRHVFNGALMTLSNTRARYAAQRESLGGGSPTPRNEEKAPR